MNLWLHATAFVRRDALEQRSYASGMLVELASMIVGIAIFFFIGAYVDAAIEPGRMAHGYFSFAVVGMALSTFLSLGLTGVATQIRQAQLSGTLELVFSAPIAPWEVALWGALWRFLYEALKVALFVGVAAAFGLPLGQANWLSAVVVLLLAVVAITPLGFLGAAFVLLWKRGDPISRFLGIASALFGGVYYPIEVLPAWLQPACLALPLTHAVMAFRAAVLEGASLAELTGPLGALAAFGAVLAPIGLWTFSRAVTQAQRRGTLATY